MGRFTRNLFIVLLVAVCCFAFVSCKDEPEHEHKPFVDVDAKAATCTENGNIQYYKCECGKLFKDISCQTEITEKDTVISALGHEFSEEAAWLTVSGKTIYCKTCEREGCNEVQEQTVAMGAAGPAGGYIFYDCDADNASGNADGLTSETCGWRYLEAAPENITIDSTISRFAFGYYRTSSDGSNFFVNGTETYNASDCTGTAIGTGKTNTEKLVEAMGNATYTASTGTETTANYAAKVADDYTVGAFDDWFLPSKDELYLVYTNLIANDIGSIPTAIFYWSSSELSGYPNAAWGQHFSSASQGDYFRNNTGSVRAVRSF